MRLRLAITAVAALVAVAGCAKTSDPASGGPAGGGPPGGGQPAGGGVTDVNGFACTALLSDEEVRAATGVADLTYDATGEAVRVRGSTICAYENAAGSHVKVTIYVDPHYAQLFTPQYTNARDTGLGRPVASLGSWAIWMEQQNEIAVDLGGRAVTISFYYVPPAEPFGDEAVATTLAKTVIGRI